MGMSIDKTIEFFNGLECHTPQAKDAKNIAVDTMRKYQQIEQILKDIPYGGEATVRRIQEVIEDGIN